MAHHDSSVGTPLYNLEEICDHFDITLDQLETFRQLPAFRAEVRAAILELQDTNSTIRRKVRKQTELYFDTLVPKWLIDESFNNAEKVKLLTLMTKVAKLIDDPAEKAKVEAEVAAKSPQQSAPTLNLYLTTAPGQQPPAIDVTPEKIISAEKIIDNE